MSLLNEYIFTFGLGAPENGGGKFVAIQAESYDAAREVMEAHFGINWAFQYNSREEAGVERFYLTEIDLSGRLVL